MRGLVNDVDLDLDLSLIDIRAVKVQLVYIAKYAHPIFGDFDFFRNFIWAKYWLSKFVTLGICLEHFTIFDTKNTVKKLANKLGL